VTLSRKGLKSDTQERKVRSTSAKARARAGRTRETRAELEEQLEACRRELAEALEQQTATSEVLSVISSSPGELEPVFQAMLANATRLCEAGCANLLLHDGKEFRLAAMHNPPPAYVAQGREPFRPHPESGLAYVARTKQIAHIDDLRTRLPYLEGSPPAVTLAHVAGARTLLLVPMLKNDELIGVIGIYRQEVCPFTEKQIELVQNFAAQAVIAVENTRLLKELRQRTDDLTEALEQQTATSEVLQVISSSPGELKPVFQAMLANATKLCEASYGAMWLREGDTLRNVAFHGALPAAFTERWQTGAVLRIDEDVPAVRAFQTRKLVHIADLRQDRAYLEGHPLTAPSVDIAGIRTLLVVPMLKEDEFVGAIAIYRREVRAFTEKQIELVSNFAAQAVIAIENTRLLNELRESLQQQTATSEVLQVISSSPGELEPVFQAMLENATHICEAKFGMLLRYHSDFFHLAAIHNAPQVLTDFFRQRGPFLPPAGSPLNRMMQTRKVIHSIDQAAEEYVAPSAKLAGARTHISSPCSRRTS
jgi:GAF domain-containing protein